MMVEWKVTHTINGIKCVEEKDAEEKLVEKDKEIAQANGVIVDRNRTTQELQAELKAMCYYTVMEADCGLCKVHCSINPNNPERKAPEEAPPAEPLITEKEWTPYADALKLKSKKPKG